MAVLVTRAAEGEREVPCPLFHLLVLAVVDLFELFMSRRAGVQHGVLWATHRLIAVNCVHAARKSNKIQIKNVNLRKKNKTKVD